MGNLLARHVDKGFDSHTVDATELPSGSAADGSQNVLYSRSTIKTSFGFDKVNSDGLPLLGTPIVPQTENNFSVDINCVAVWNLDDGKLTTDSKGTNTLTNNGATADTGNFKQGDASAVFVKAEDDFMTIADADLDAGFPFKNGDTTKDMSVCTWMYLNIDDSPAFDGIWSKRGSGGDSIELGLSDLSGTLRVKGFYTFSGGTRNFEDNLTTIVAGRWYHIVLTYKNSTNTWVLRIWDDVAKSATLSTGNTDGDILSSSESFDLASVDGGDVSSDIQLDEVVVFNDVLSTEEIDEIRSGTFGPVGAPILGLAKWSQLDLTEHFMAVTNDKIYRNNNITSSWDDVTKDGGSDLGGDEQLPVSFATIAHTDPIKLNGDGANAFRHFLVNPGGTGKIQRWAGNRETDFADLLGGDGYHDSASNYTGHYALQVGAVQNHVLLISPREGDKNNELVSNPQRVRYSQVGKLESWAGAGSGTIELIDTGGFNVWGAVLGKQWIQYQNNAIYSLTHVGGTQEFAPRLEFPDLGLLSEHLLYTKNNIHYFLGSDFNLYAYLGGSTIRVIGNKVQRYIQRDFERAKLHRCWLSMGAENSRLWLYGVPKGSDFATFAYGIDMITGSWMKRDLTHKWPTTSVGISAVALVGSGSYETGLTYNQLINSEKAPAKTVEIGGCVRSSNVVTTTTDVPHGFEVAETVALANVDSGSETNAFSGSFEIASVPSTTTFTHAQTGADESNLAEGTALVDKAPTGTDYINLGITSQQMLSTVLTDEVISLGDSEGNVYQFSSSATQDDSVDIPARHITEIYDLGEPSLLKLWPPFRISAKGTGLIVSYRTGNFETTGTGWNVFAELSLTGEYVNYFVNPNDSSAKIQFRFTNADSDDFQIANYDLGRPEFIGEV